MLMLEHLTSSDAHRIADLRAGFDRLLHHAIARPTWLGRAIEKTGDTIKKHPIATIGIALGLGLGVVTVRLLRR